MHKILNIIVHRIEELDNITMTLENFVMKFDNPVVQNKADLDISVAFESRIYLILGRKFCLYPYRFLKSL